MKRIIFITKFTKYWWNNFVFKFSKEHHRCSMKYTGFSIYTFRKIFFFMKRFFTMMRFVQNDRGLWNGLFLSQSSLSIGEIISFLSSQRNIIDVLWSTQVFLFTLLEKSFSSWKDSSLWCASFRMTGVYETDYFYHKVH